LFLDDRPLFIFVFVALLLLLAAKLPQWHVVCRAIAGLLMMIMAVPAVEPARLWGILLPAALGCACLFASLADPLRRMRWAYVTWICLLLAVIVLVMPTFAWAILPIFLNLGAAQILAPWSMLTGIFGLATFFRAFSDSTDHTMKTIAARRRSF
jgi:hypothetical protein